MHHWRSIILLTGLTTAGILGCAAPRTKTADTQALLSRLQAIDQAESLRRQSLETLTERDLTAPQDNALRQILLTIAAGAQQPLELQTTAIDVLVQRYDREIAVPLATALLTTAATATQMHLLTHLEALESQDTLPHVVTFWAENRRCHPDTPAVTDAWRTATILAGDLDTALSAIAQNPKQHVRMRLAALAALVNTQGMQTAGRTLTATTVADHDIFAQEVRYWSKEWGYVPTNGPRLQQCHAALTQLAPTQLAHISARAASLRQARQIAADVRDAYVLAHMEEERIGRSSLETTLAGRLAASRHQQRASEAAAGAADYREDFAGQHNLLRYTDLVAINWLLSNLETPEFTGRLRRVCKADRADIDNELGGLVFLQKRRATELPHKVSFRRYDTVKKTGDWHFADPPQMQRDGAWCLARWHCHAAPAADATWAGPGVDDFCYAAYYNCPVVIVTQLDRNDLNIDYLTPEGIVIDLGIY